MARAGIAARLGKREDQRQCTIHILGECQDGQVVQFNRRIHRVRGRGIRRVVRVPLFHGLTRQIQTNGIEGLLGTAVPGGREQGRVARCARGVKVGIVRSKANMAGIEDKAAKRHICTIHTIIEERVVQGQALTTAIQCGVLARIKRIGARIADIAHAIAITVQLIRVGNGDTVIHQIWNAVTVRVRLIGQGWVDQQLGIEIVRGAISETEDTARHRGIARNAKAQGRIANPHIRCGRQDKRCQWDGVVFREHDSRAYRWQNNNRATQNGEETRGRIGKRIARPMSVHQGKDQGDVVKTKVPHHLGTHVRSRQLRKRETGHDHDQAIHASTLITGARSIVGKEGNVRDGLRHHVPGKTHVHGPCRARKHEGCRRTQVNVENLDAGRPWPEREDRIEDHIVQAINDQGRGIKVTGRKGRQWAPNQEDIRGQIREEIGILIREETRGRRRNRQVGTQPDHRFRGVRHGQKRTARQERARCRAMGTEANVREQGHAFVHEIRVVPAAEHVAKDATRFRGAKRETRAIKGRNDGKDHTIRVAIRPMPEERSRGRIVLVLRAFAKANAKRVSGMHDPLHGSSLT